MKKIYLILILIIYCPIIVNAKVVELDRCIDGDTARFFTEKGSESVRFLAIDTPETNHPQKGREPFGQEASDFTCQKLKDANEIRLEFDENSDRYDRYDRLLAWIFVDDVLLQSLIIEEGLGEVAYLYGDYKYTEKLQIKQAEAKLQKIGIWSDTNDLDVFSIGIGSIIFMAMVNFIYFYYRSSRKSFINKIYNNNNQSLKIILIIVYLVTIVGIVHDFAIVASNLAKYKRKVGIK